MYTHNPPEQFSLVTRAERRWPYRRWTLGRLPTNSSKRDPASDRPPRLSGSTTAVVSDEAAVTHPRLVGIPRL